MKNLSTKIFLFAMTITAVLMIANFHYQKLLMVDLLSSDLFQFTNQIRTENKLPELVLNKSLQSAAQSKAEDMAAKGYFSHNSPDGSRFTAFLEAENYDFLFAGENLGVKFTDSKALIEAWMDSEKHRENILGINFTEIGFGIAEGEYKGKKAFFVVEFFGKPRNSFAIIENYQSETIASGSWTDLISSQDFLAVENKSITLQDLVRPERLGAKILDFIPLNL